MKKKNKKSKNAQTKRNLSKSDRIKKTAATLFLLGFALLVLVLIFSAFSTTEETAETPSKNTSQELSFGHVEEIILKNIPWATVTVDHGELNEGEVTAQLNCSDSFLYEFFQINNEGSKLVISGRKAQAIDPVDQKGLENFSFSLLVSKEIDLSVINVKHVDVRPETQIDHLKVGLRSGQTVDATVARTISGYIKTGATANLHALIRNTKLFVDGGTLNVSNNVVGGDLFQLGQDDLEGAVLIFRNNGIVNFKSPISSNIGSMITFLGPGTLNNGQQTLQPETGKYTAEKDLFSFFVDRSDRVDYQRKYPVFWDYTGRSISI